MSKPEEQKVNWAELSDSDQENGKNKTKNEEPSPEHTQPTEEGVVITLVPKKKKSFPTTEEMIAEVRKLDKERVYIFLNNLSHEATEEDIRMFYKDHKISKIFPKQKLSGAFDVQFDSKEDAIKFLEAGTGKIRGRQFYANISNKNYRAPADDNKERPKKEKYGRYDNTKPYEKSSPLVEYRVKDTNQSGDYYKSYKNKDTTGEIKRSTIEGEKKEAKPVEEKPKEVIQRKGRGEMKFLADGDQQLEQDKIIEGQSKAEQGQKKNYSVRNDWKEGSNKYDKYDSHNKQGSKYYNSREDRPKKDYYGGNPQGYKKKTYNNFEEFNDRGKNDSAKLKGSKATYQAKKTTAPSYQQTQAETEAQKKPVTKNHTANPFGALNDDNEDNE